MAEYLIQDTTLTGIADAIRGKTGETGTIPVPDMASKIDGIQTGGGSAGGVSPKAVNFYDYDGTVLHAYTKEEFLALTEMPPLPEREGLICQEWNWSFEAMQDYTSKYGVCNAGATYITDDGTTRIYITLHEGRTSPMLGVCPNGTVTVDWGDGTTPDVLTGTSTSTVMWTPNHEYASPGDYVIRLTVDGEMGFFGNDSTNQNSGILRYSSSADARNYYYRNAVQKIEVGDGVTSIGSYAFQYCNSLASVAIPSGVKSISSYAFRNCYSLASVAIPSSVTSISSYAFQNCSSLAFVVIPSGVKSISSYAFQNCYSLAFVAIPSGVTSLGNNAFYGCYSLAFVAIPSGVTSIGNNAFQYCYGLASVTIPSSVTSIGNNAFQYCYSLAFVAIPSGVTSIGNNAFNSCSSLASVTIPSGVKSISSYAFYSCYSLAFVDFTSHTAVPTLSATNAFTNTPADCQIRVPAALYDAWIAATNWSTYASQIVAV